MPRKNQPVEISEEVREGTREIFRSQFNDKLEQLTEDQIVQLESSIQTDDICLYAKQVIKLLENLKSDYVLEKIRKNEWNITEIVNLERETLNPKKWQDLQEARIPKNTKKERRKGTNRCPKCRSWYTTHKQSQTRSADEGLTTRCHCEDCDYHWKFG